MLPGMSAWHIVYTVLHPGMHSCACIGLCDTVSAVICVWHMCRRAYELAFASAYMFAGQRPVFKEIDEVTFKRPVDIGDLLRLTSSILHTQPSTQDPNKVSIPTLVPAPLRSDRQAASPSHFLRSVKHAGHASVTPHKAGLTMLDYLVCF